MEALTTTCTDQLRLFPVAATYAERIARAADDDENRGERDMIACMGRTAYAWWRLSG